MRDSYLFSMFKVYILKGRRDRECMVIRLTPSFVFSAYHLYNCLPVTRCTRYNFIWECLSVTCSRWMVFSGYFSSTTKTTYCQYITEILFKVPLNKHIIRFWYLNDHQHYSWIYMFHLSTRSWPIYWGSPKSQEWHCDIYQSTF